jgi:hypothetical protein
MYVQESCAGRRRGGLRYIDMYIRRGEGNEDEYVCRCSTSTVHS